MPRDGRTRTARCRRATSAAVPRRAESGAGSPGEGREPVRERQSRGPRKCLSSVCTDGAGSDHEAKASRVPPTPGILLGCRLAFVIVPAAVANRRQLPGQATALGAMTPHYTRYVTSVFSYSVSSWVVPVPFFAGLQRPPSRARSWG